MTTRRKTWVGVGLVAMAGTATRVLAATHAIHSPQPPAMAHTAAERLLLLAQAAGGEAATVQGGEGGDVAVPQSYALPGANAADFTYDASAEIANYAAGVEATYVASLADAKTMAAAIDAFLANPSDETLAAARKAWTAARPSYLQSEAFRFYDGPIEAVEGEINSWPMNEAFIDYVVGNANAGIINDPASSLTVASLIVSNMVSDESDVTLGWHAIEFLLWGQDLDPDGPGARPASDYKPGVGNNDRRREYLKLVTERLVADIGRLVPAWAPGQPDNYAATLRAQPTREAIGRIINGMAVLAGSELMSERMAVGLDSHDQEDEDFLLFRHHPSGLRLRRAGDRQRVEGPVSGRCVRARHQGACLEGRSRPGEDHRRAASGRGDQGRQAPQPLGSGAGLGGRQPLAAGRRGGGDRARRAGGGPEAGGREARRARANPVRLGDEGHDETGP